MSDRHLVALLCGLSVWLPARHAHADAPPTVRTAIATDEAATTPPRRYTEDRDRHGPLVPDYLRVGTGGFLGAFQIHIGYSVWKDRFNLGVQYGYTPPWNEAPHVQTFAGTFTVRPLHLDLPRGLYLVPAYVGGGAMVSAGPNLFVEQPPVYPKGYYAPTAVQLLVLAGLELGARTVEGSFLARQGLYFEVVTINQYLDALADNRDAKLLDAFSSAAGYRAWF